MLARRMARRHAVLVARVARLEGELAAEQKRSLMHEAFLRKIGDAVKKLHASPPPVASAAASTSGTMSPTAELV